MRTPFWWRCVRHLALIVVFIAGWALVMYAASSDDPKHPAKVAAPIPTPDEGKIESQIRQALATRDKEADEDTLIRSLAQADAALQRCQSQHK